MPVRDKPAPMIKSRLQSDDAFGEFSLLVGRRGLGATESTVALGVSGDAEGSFGSMMDGTFNKAVLPPCARAGDSGDVDTGEAADSGMNEAERGRYTKKVSRS